MSVSRQALCKAFGVRLVSDIHERSADLGLSLPMGRKRRDRLVAIRDTGLLFVHVPKAAGMAVSQALYGLQVKHASMRYYRRALGGLGGIASFAVVRDPVERFLSAYHYGRAGGSSVNDVAEPFCDIYRAFRSIDEALDHVEAARSAYDVDHIFRPQHWYVAGQDGRILVDRLVAIEDIDRLGSLVGGCPVGPIARINASHRTTGVELSPRQRARILSLYPKDFALYRKARMAGLVSSESKAAAPRLSRGPLPAL